jgi:hypothetical protein
MYRLIIAFTFILLSADNNFAQMDSLSNNNADTIYILSGDTIFTNKDFNFYVGQKLIVGKGRGEREWYQTVSFRSGLSWPLIFLQKMEMKNNLEYQSDPSIREKDKVRDFLSSGDTLIITKIKKYGKRRIGYWYEVFLGQKQGFLSLNFRANILEAIRSEELKLIKEKL